MCGRFARIAAENPYAWFRDGGERRGDRHRHRRQPHDRVPVPEAHERHPRREPGRRARSSRARRRRAARRPARALGVSLGRRRRDRAVVRPGPARLPLDARRASARARCSSRRPACRSATSRHLDLYSCFPIAPRLSAATLGHPRGRPASAHRHGRPAVVRRARQQLLDARDRDDDGSPAGRAGKRRRSCMHSAGSSPSTGSGCTRRTPPPHGWRRAGGPDLQEWVDALPHPEVVAGALGARRRSRPTPSSTAATGRRSAAS